MYTRDYERNRYREIRAEMILSLGGVCCQCGSVESLEFNHLVERFWDPNKYHGLGRLRQYKKDIEKGHINLLCRSCNARFIPEPNEEVPF